MKRKILKIVEIILWIDVFVLSAIFITAFAVSLKTPELNRNWEDDSIILPHITISTSTSTSATPTTVTVQNIRDWRYKKGKVISSDYYDDTFDLEKMKSASLLLNPFGKWEGVGHTFLIFEFEDGKKISVSIEARREKGEVYQALKKGLFNEYEVWYAFGSPEDFTTRRAIYHNEDLYEYPLLIATSTAKTLFLDLAQTAVDLETTPDFYNTLTSNCTNLLAESANRVKEGSIPWNKARLFTGFGDNQLYDLGLIANDKPFEEIYMEARIDEKIRAGTYLF
jgi:hypothetical protein